MGTDCSNDSIMLSLRPVSIEMKERCKPRPPLTHFFGRHDLKFLVLSEGTCLIESKNLCLSSEMDEKVMF